MEFQVELWIIIILIVVSDFSYICGQGNRGVIINNQKVEDEKIVIPTNPNNLSTSNFGTTMRSVWQTPDAPESTKALFKHFKRPHRKRGQTSRLATSKGNFNKILSILNKNQTNFNKLDELVMQMNSTGSLTQINWINVNEKGEKMAESTPAPHLPIIDKVYRDKDSKELKVQFVLDCDLKDSLQRQKGISLNPQVTRPVTRKPIQQLVQSPPRVQSQVIYYPVAPASNYQDSYQSPLKPIKFRPFQVPQTSFNSVTKSKPKPSKATTPKTNIKNVYVDPPAIASISNTFDNIYSYFEDVFTTKVKVPRKQAKANHPSQIPVVSSNVMGGKLPRHRPIVKRSTVSNSRVRPSTISPISRSTKFHSNDVQRLTTQIHVTSQYVGKNPTTTVPSTTTEEYSEESDEYDDLEEDDDDDDDYYDSESFEGFGADVSNF